MSLATMILEQPARCDFWQQLAPVLSEQLELSVESLLPLPAKSVPLALESLAQQAREQRKTQIHRQAAGLGRGVTHAAIWDGTDVRLGLSLRGRLSAEEAQRLEELGWLLGLRCQLGARQVAARLERRVGERLGDQQSRSLAIDLRTIAETMAEEVPLLSGAVLVAFDDEDFPLAVGTSGLVLEGDASLRQLWELGQELDTDSGWTRVVTVWLQVTGEALARKLRVEGGYGGLLILDFKSDDPDMCLAWEAVEQCLPFLAATVGISIQLETTARLRELHALAKCELERKPLRLEQLVRDLNALFHSGTAALFLRAQSELRLSATTDSHLKSQEVVYRPGEGLTGHLFEAGESLRLLDTEDREEVRRKTGLDRRGPLHPEGPFVGGITARFLAVPIRSGERVVGVLRLCREQSQPRFNLQDEQALRFFGDLLGTALAFALESLVFDCIMESSSVGLAVSRREPAADGGFLPRIILTNAGTQEILGGAAEDLRGHDARELYAPGAYERLEGRLEDAFRQAASRRENVEIEPVLTRIRRLDGTFRSVKISYRLVVDRSVQPPSFYTIGLARDTTESQIHADQHKRLMEMLDEMGIAYFRCDSDGFTLETSPAEERITGYAGADLACFPRQRLYVNPAERDHLMTKTRRNFPRLVEARQLLRRRDDTRIWIAGALRLIKDAAGKEGFEGLYRDVTERLKLQTFLNAPTDRLLPEHELNQKLRENAEFHLDYVSSVGHQLLAPLSSLLGNLENWEKLLPPGSRALARMPYVVGQARVCARMVKNLSFMDKILRGESFHREWVPLAKLAIETKLDFQHLLDAGGLHLEIDDASLRRLLKVRVHREMLRQVMVNLVDNAIKYSVRRSKIVIRAFERPDGHVFEIKNRGLPIPAELREKIFERGYRSRKAKMKIPAGTGLGLWLVRRIVEAHDATIRCLVLTEQGREWTLFHILFPRSQHRFKRRSHR